MCRDHYCDCGELKEDCGCGDDLTESVKVMAREFMWHTMDGRDLTLDEMHTGHIFNIMKMLYNHLASVSDDCSPIWFNHVYGDYQDEADDDPMNLCQQVVLFIWEIERRGNLPDKYRTPYKQILNQIFKIKMLETTVEGLIKGGSR